MRDDTEGKTPPCENTDVAPAKFSPLRHQPQPAGVLFNLRNDKVNSAGDQSFLQTVTECYSRSVCVCSRFQHVFPIKRQKKQNPRFPQLILERRASPQQRTSAHLKLSCAIFFFFFLKTKRTTKTFQSNSKADCNPESKSLRLVSFFSLIVTNARNVIKYVKAEYLNQEILSKLFFFFFPLSNMTQI